MFGSGSSMMAMAAQPMNIDSKPWFVGKMPRKEVRKSVRSEDKVVEEQAGRGEKGGVLVIHAGFKIQTRV